ncbi:hypothetical protein NITMOv2_4678 [Nitrospira moscoviensis]|uniref:Uncharacterized protein n=1 Tax=Nitrospira moscoviensis TaxID=42253 RepID=A0A0K2GJM2_NITMO|nr:hypothetical protein NITMOv2_0104 [Nitrospira moscoviensis]ALA61049.1 hypothetical protein NITMOv2_4678 [Nitrospira moscoviensis]
MHMPCDIFSHYVTHSNESWNLSFSYTEQIAQKCTQRRGDQISVPVGLIEATESYQI